MSSPKPYGQSPIDENKWYEYPEFAKEWMPTEKTEQANSEADIIVFLYNNEGRSKKTTEIAKEVQKKYTSYAERFEETLKNLKKFEEMGVVSSYIDQQGYLEWALDSDLYGCMYNLNRGLKIPMV